MATFQVTASSLTTMTYKWYLDGVVIGGATSSTYIITKVQASQAGVYKVDVSNLTGTTASSNATLSVLGSGLPPISSDDNYSVPEDQPLTVVPATGVLSNDTDPNGLVMSALLVSSTIHGTLTLKTNGSFTYTPVTNYSGSDTFTYRPSDDLSTGNLATVTITVLPVNDSPVLSGANDLAAITEDSTTNNGTLVSALLAGKVTDPDDSALSGIAVFAVDNTYGVWQLTINNGGSWAAFGSPSASVARLLAADANTRVRFVPFTNWAGTVNGGLSFVAWDQTSGTAGGAASLGTISTLLDQFSSVAYTNNNGTANWSGSWVETDKDGGGASAGLIRVNGGRLDLTANRTGDSIYRSANLSGASSATLSLNYVNALSSDDSFVIQVSRDGGTTYTNLPDGAFSNTTNSGSGTLSFDLTPFISANVRIRVYESDDSAASHLYLDNVQITIIASSPGGAFSANSASARITVNPVNDAPVANNDNAVAYKNYSVTIPVLSNDTDVEGDPLTLIGVATPNGSTQVSGTNVVFTPATNFIGTVVFNYTISDGSLTATGQVTVSVINTTLSLATVTTLGVANVTTNSATLKGSVNPQGDPTTGWFQYGLTTNYGAQSATVAFPPGTNAVSLSKSISSLSPGTVYHYRAVATNAGGPTVGLDATFTTAFLPPAVTTLPASNLSTNSATLNAAVNQQGTAVTYYFQYGLTTNYGSFTTTNALTAGSGNLPGSAPITGLTPGTLYHCRAVAVSAGGTSVALDVTFTTAYPPPSATTLAASNIATTSASLNGTVNPQGTTAGCYFQFGLTTNYGSFTATNVLAAGSNVAPVAVLLAGLAPGTVYHCRVVAVNSGGTGVGADAVFTTSFPSPTVATLSASDVTTASVSLNATVDPQGTMATWHFQYGLTTNYGSFCPTNTLVPVAGNFAASDTTVPVTALITGLTPGTQYHCRVVAVNSGGTSVGADGTFTTAAAVPVRLHLGVASVGGRMRFTLAAAAATSFTVVSTTNLALPVSNWIVVGTMTEMSPGHYEYIEVPASTLQQCYYSLRFP